LRAFHDLAGELGEASLADGEVEIEGFFRLAAAVSQAIIMTFMTLRAYRPDDVLARLHC
jgi:hypothetical protein